MSVSAPAGKVPDATENVYAPFVSGCACAVSPGPESATVPVGVVPFAETATWIVSD